MSGEHLASFDYDGFHRRIRKTTSRRTVETTWSGWRALEEHEDGRLRFRKVYGSGLDEILRLESDADGNGTLEAAYLPVYDETGNLAGLLDEIGKPVARYRYSPYGGTQVTTVDPLAPRPTQVRVEGRNVVVLQLSEEVSEDALREALEAGGVSLSRVTASRAKSAVALSVEPVVHRGTKARREWAFTLGEEPAVGEEVELVLAPESLEDGFLNQPGAEARFRFTWPSTTPTSAQVLVDATAPRIDLVTILGGHLEVELSEPPAVGTLATGLLVNGSPVAWELQPDRHTLRSVQPLPLGDHELVATTNLTDLAGLGLPEPLTVAFTWAGTTAGELLHRGEDPNAPTVLTRSSGEKSALDDVTAVNLGFHGQPYDPETGLYYFRHRYYDASLARF